MAICGAQCEGLAAVPLQHICAAVRGFIIYECLYGECTSPVRGVQN